MADDPRDPMDGFGLGDLRRMLSGFEEALETARRVQDEYERGLEQPGAGDDVSPGSARR